MYKIEDNVETIQDYNNIQSTFVITETSNYINIYYIYYKMHNNIQF